MIYRKSVAQFSYSDSQRKDVNLGNTEFLRNVSIEFAGTLTAAGGTTDGALQQDGLLRTVAKNIVINANGNDPFVTTDAIGEYFRRAIMTGSPGVLVSTMPTGAASTAQRVHFQMDMDQIQSAARFAGRVAAARLATLELTIYAGAVETDMVVGGDRTETMTGTYTVVCQFDSDPSNYKGGGRRVSKKRLPVTVANNLAEIPLPSGQMIGQILLVVVNNAARSNALLTDVEAKIGERDSRFKSTFLDVQSDNVEVFGLELASGAPPYAGIALLHFDADGDMSPRKLLNTVGLRVEGGKLVLNVGTPTGTAYVDAYVYAVDPVAVGR